MTDLSMNISTPNISTPIYRSGVASASGAGWRLTARAICWCLAGVACSFLMAVFAGVVIGATGLVRAMSPDAMTTVYVAAAIIGMQGVLLLGARSSRTTALHRPARSRMNAGVGSRYLTVGLITVAIVAYAAMLNFGVFDGNHNALVAFAGRNWAIVVIWLVLVTVIAPLCEELFFRRWLWAGLEPCWGPLAAAFVTSGLWLALHLPDGLVKTTLLLPLAIALPLARHFGGSVGASIFVHALNNLAATTMPWIFLALGWLSLS